LDKWEAYLLGQRFHDETDHKPLEWIRTTRDPRERLARWVLRLQEYNFTTRVVPGKEHDLADWLSRPEFEDEAPTITSGANSLVVQLDPGRSHFERLSLNEAGISSWNDTDSDVMLSVIPGVLRRKLIVKCHEVARTGCTKTYDLPRQKAYWAGMRSEVMAYVASCKRCRLRRGHTTRATHPMEPIFASEIGWLWSVGVMGHPGNDQRELIYRDNAKHLSRWVETAEVPSQRATTITGVVMNEIATDNGAPKMILAHQGPCFGSEELRSCLQIQATRSLRTAPYHPETTGLTERNNRAIKDWRRPMEPAKRLSPEELGEGRRKARENLTAVQERNREEPPSRKARPFPTSARVKWRAHQNPGRTGLGSRKLGSHWQGPFVVIDCRGSVYTIQDGRELIRVDGT
ncbi:pro-Pol polyprotein, partial [Clonorchis sinensis]